MYEGRLTHSEDQAGITLTDLKVEDEGSIKCEVTLSSLEVLTGTVILQVMSKHILQRRDF